MIYVTLYLNGVYLAQVSSYRALVPLSVPMSSLQSSIRDGLNTLTAQVLNTGNGAGGFRLEGVLGLNPNSANR